MARLNAYQKFFQSKLKAFGVSSPAALPADQRGRFWNEIKRQWKGKKDRKESNKRIGTLKRRHMRPNTPDGAEIMKLQKESTKMKLRGIILEVLEEELGSMDDLVDDADDSDKEMEDEEMEDEAAIMVGKNKRVPSKKRTASMKSFVKTLKSDTKKREKEIAKLRK